MASGACYFSQWSTSPSFKGKLLLPFKDPSGLDLHILHCLCLVLSLLSWSITWPQRPFIIIKSILLERIICVDQLPFFISYRNISHISYKRCWSSFITCSMHPSFPICGDLGFLSTCSVLHLKPWLLEVSRLSANCILLQVKFAACLLEP